MKGEISFQTQPHWYPLRAIESANERDANYGVFYNTCFPLHISVLCRLKTETKTRTMKTGLLSTTVAKVWKFALLELY